MAIMGRRRDADILPGEENHEQSNHQSELNFFNMDIEPDMMPSVSVEPKGMSHVIDIPNTKKPEPQVRRTTICK